MNFRKERIHHNGASNLDYRTTDKDINPFKFHPSSSSIEFLSKPKSWKNIEFYQAENEKKQIDPKKTTKSFYEILDKNHHAKTKIAYPRTSHLEEIDKRKRVFAGDSNSIFNDKIHTNSNLSKYEDKKKGVNQFYTFYYLFKNILFIRSNIIDSG